MAIDARIPLMVEQFKLPDFAGIERQRKQDAMKEQEFQQDQELVRQRIAGGRADMASKEKDLAARDALTGLLKQHSKYDDATGVYSTDRKAVISGLAASGYPEKAAELQKQFDAETKAQQDRDLAVRKQEHEERKLKKGTTTTQRDPVTGAITVIHTDADGNITMEDKEPLGGLRKPSDSAAVLAATIRSEGAKDRAAALAAAKAANRGGSGGAGTLDDNGKISAVLRNRAGGSKLDPVVVKNLEKSQLGVDLGVELLKEIPDILSVIPNASSSTAGEYIGKAQTFLGVGETGAANKRLDQFANTALGVIDSPLMKGAPSENDARRALSVINDPQAPEDVKKNAITRLQSLISQAVSDHDDALNQYDDETVQRLKGVGIRVVGDRAKPPVKITGKVMSKQQLQQIAKDNGITYEEAIKQLPSGMVVK